MKTSNSRRALMATGLTALAAAQCSFASPRAMPSPTTANSGLAALSGDAGPAGQEAGRALSSASALSSTPASTPASALSSTPASVASTTTPPAPNRAPETPAPAAGTSLSAPPAKELPRGGRVLFPTYRLVGYCGTPGAPALGELQGNLPAKARALEAKAAKYEVGRAVLPVFELIAVVVQSGAGSDGMYRRRVDSSIIDEYLRVARQFKAILLLNIQPGRSDFVTEVRAFESYLREPDVGLALDPEWAMKPKQRPGVYFGQMTGQTLNEVGEYLSGIVAQNDLPEKALVFHQVNRDVLKDEAVVRSFPGVAVIKSVDGLGPMHAKINTYGNLMELITPGVHPGFKLFFDEDQRNNHHLMTPSEVLALSPQPEYVMYE